MPKLLGRWITTATKKEKKKQTYQNQLYRQYLRVLMNYIYSLFN
jgi:hypothetical protein